MTLAHITAAFLGMAPSPEQLGFLLTVIMAFALGWTCRLARREDPATSKQAARRVVKSGRLTKDQEWALAILHLYGPGTCRELASRQICEEVTFVYHMLTRRLVELKRKSPPLARIQRDAHGKDLRRDGSRCWEVVP